MLVKLQYNHLQKLFDPHLTEYSTEKDQNILKGPDDMIKNKSYRGYLDTLQWAYIHA